MWVEYCSDVCSALCFFFDCIQHSSGDRTCGCRSVAFAAVQTQNKKVIELCENYLNFVGIQNGLQVAAVMSVIVVNIAYVVVTKATPLWTVSTALPVVVLF